MGCQQTKRVDVTLEASSVKWGKQACLSATLASVVQNDFLEFRGFDPNLGAKDFYIWFDEGTGTDPEKNGTAIPVVVLNSDTDAEKAAKAVTAINALTAPDNVFKASATGAVLHIENRFIGKSEELTSSATITVDLEIPGVGINLGSTSAGIETSFEVNLLDIQTNQTGELIVDQVFQGIGASLSAPFIEITKAKFDELVGNVTGATVTPASGTAVTGFGESRLFQSLLELGGQLILHPIRKADTDYTEDVVFWKSAPVPQSENFDGTAAKALEIEFVAYLDVSKKKEINLYAKGDWTQVDLDA